MTELRKQFKKEHPETIGETDKAFDDSNYIDWLEAKVEELKQEKCTIQIVRHGSEMIAEEYVYKNDFRFQRTQKHGIWFVTYQNHLITFGQYRHDLEEWIDSNYA